MERTAITTWCVSPCGPSGPQAGGDGGFGSGSASRAAPRTSQSRVGEGVSLTAVRRPASIVVCDVSAQRPSRLWWFGQEPGLLKGRGDVRLHDGHSLVVISTTEPRWDRAVVRIDIQPALFYSVCFFEPPTLLQPRCRGRSIYIDSLRRWSLGQLLLELVHGDPHQLPVE